MNRFTSLIQILLVLSFNLFSQPCNESYSYAVVIKSEAYQDAGWKAVADTLLTIHGKTASQLFQWNSSVTEVKTELAQFMPDYIAFVCKPVTDASNSFIKTVLNFTRELDSDPYFDAVWSIVTGYEPQDAIRAVTSRLRCRTEVVGPDGVGIKTQQGVQFPVDPPKVKYHFADGHLEDTNDPTNIGSDRIVPISKWLNEGIHIEMSGHPAIEGPVDLFVTGGHGNVNAWQAHFPSSDGEGFLRSGNGQLYGDPYSGDNVNINKTTPTVYFAINNCLVGCPDNIGNMVYAWFHTGGATHMFGFIVSTGASHAGYSTFKRMTDRVNPSESYFLAMNNLKFSCEKDIAFSTWSESQFVFNLENTIMYGDPRGDVYFDSAYSSSENKVINTLELIETAPQEPDTFVFTSTWNTDDYKAYEWWHRDLRPVMCLPARIDPATVSIIKNELHTHEICDNILLADPWRSDECTIGAKKTLTWTAKVITNTTDLAHTSHHITKNTAWLKVSPLANTGLIMVRFKMFKPGNVVLSIFSAAGREVFVKSFVRVNTEETQCVTLTMNNANYNLTSGIYYMVLKTGGFVLKDKFVYIH